MQNKPRKEKINMKLFEMPEIDVVKFAFEDVITTSGDEEPNPSTEEFCL